MIRKSFIAAVLVAMTVFAFSIAQAAQTDGLANLAGPASPTNIYVNPGSLGDALIYGYYNARGSFNYFRVVNTSTSFGVGVKLRFREGKNSNEVFDMFICLSAADQWSGWVLDDGATGTPASLIWYDNDTPTFPDPQGSTNNLATDNFLASQPFHYSATGAASSVTASDTKEGYFEIIGVSAWADVPGTKTVRTPNACGETILGSTIVDESAFTRPALVDVPNTLMGNSYIFNIAAGQGTYAYNATALADFRNAIVLTPGLGTDDPPTLADATEGLIAVNYILTKAHELAIYDISDDLKGQTDIINTFPTKRLSIVNDPGSVNGPFNDAATVSTAGVISDATARCETVSVRIWDDAENTPGSSLGFSPPPPSQSLQKCDEVSYMVVGLNADSLLTTGLKQFNINDNGFQLGWVDIDFTTIANRTTTVTNTTTGLPVISYELQGLVDGFFTHMLPLRYTTQIQ